jgi:hypothetical protein
VARPWERTLRQAFGADLASETLGAVFEARNLSIWDAERAGNDVVQIAVGNRCVVALDRARDRGAGA